ncbi:MAG: hypothetical protein GXX91_17095 [Verrucomicrobiaceae bacterium]|nr:hypothetical protein [Verrucomicrobiaceae bacterium]
MNSSPSRLLWKRRRLVAAAGLCLVFGSVSPAQEEAPSPADPAPPSAPGEGAGSSAEIGEASARSSVVEVPAKDWGEDYQVRVRGGSPRTRVTFHSFCKDYRDDFRWLLYWVHAEREAWSVPIEVVLWGEMSDVHKGESVLTKVQVRPDHRFLIRLEVKLHDDFEESEFRLKLMEALLIEQILAPYALHPDDFALEKVKVPEWMVHGFDQLVLHRRSGSPSAFYRGFLTSGQMLKPDEIVAVAEVADLDAVHYAIFRASASAMVEALIDQPDGGVAMRSLLGDLGRTGRAAIDVLLRQHFPAVRELGEGLDKWWALEVASLGQRQSFEFLGREETERLLTEALTLRFEGVPDDAPVAIPVKRGLFRFGKTKNEPLPEEGSGPFVGTIDKYQSYLGRAGVKEQLTQAFEKLQHVKRSGFPLYRPVFAKYEQILIQLATGDLSDLDAELAACEEMRTKIRETLIRTEDYLNYFEATRAPQRSEAFEEYMTLRKRLEEAAAPHRNDRISRYLDALEREFR